ncbi:hypothetical protein RCL1_004620 [Eukaryota sp. TZLM3-RCL]
MSSLEQIDSLILDVQSRMNLKDRTGRVLCKDGFVMNLPFENRGCPLCLIRSYKDKQLPPPVELSPLNLKAIAEQGRIRRESKQQKEKPAEKPSKKAPQEAPAPVVEKAEVKPVSAPTPTTSTPAAKPDIEMFSKAFICVGQVVEMDVHPSADKLIAGKIDIGAEEPRQVVAGLRHHFNTSDLIGKKFVCIANLKPAKLVGIESQVMLLAGTGPDGTVKLIDPPSDAAPGTRIQLEGVPVLAEQAKTCNSKSWGKIVDLLQVVDNAPCYGDVKFTINGQVPSIVLPNGSKIK